MSWYCSLPFNHIYTDPAGRYRLCCVSNPLDKNIHETSMTEYFYSDDMDNIRQEFLSGNLNKVKNLCTKCIDQEKAGDVSYRQLWSEEIEQLKSGERHMTFKLSLFGSFCNLSCYMCDPVNSTRRESDLKKIGWLNEFYFEKNKPSDIDDILNQLQPFLPYTTAFVIIGGEPLLIDSHYKFLDGLIKSGESKNISLSYTSNLTMKVDKFNSYIDKFKQVRMSVSIDGLYERNDYIRYGSNFETILDNIKNLNCHTQIYYTVSILSVFQCNEANEFFNNITDFNIVDSPDFLSIRHLPHEVKLQLLDNISINKVRTELKKERSEEQWQKALKYISDLDKKRNRKAGDIFYELSEFL